MPGWKNAPAIVALKAAIVARFPAHVRGTEYLGTIGDQSHAARKSEHNPDARGYVRALDVGALGGVGQQIVDALLAAPDERLWYVIHNGYIYSRKHGFARRVYSGADPHHRHVHVSVVTDPAVYMRDRPWALGGGQGAAQGTLREGAHGATVRLLQDGLRRVFPAYAGQLAIDGVWGAKTTAVVREFQRRSGLQVDGVVGPRTREAMRRAGVRL